MDEEQVGGVGLQGPIEGLVLNLARLADRCGLDGIVCSPQELDRLSHESFERIFFVTPGIRPSGSSLDDQARTNTATGAIQMGARYLVIGRPIIQSDNPASAARRIVEEIQHAKIKVE
jgi:orotidine-5'-phosphate decarboxylase